MNTLPPHAHNSNPIPTTSGIYKITCTANKRIYIGSAANLRARKRQHFSDLRHNKHHNSILQNAWNKYGEQAFTFEVLELVLPMSLTAREQYWFNKLRPFGRKGFNVLREAGNNLGHKVSPETREKLRQVNLGKKMSPEAVEKTRQATLGRKCSPETKERMSAWQRGKCPSPEIMEKARQANLGNKNRLGKKHTPETRMKISQATRGRKLSPEHIAKRTSAQTGLKRSPETIEKIRQGKLRKKNGGGLGNEYS